MKISFSEQEKRDIINSYEGGESSLVIAERMGVCVHTILKRLKKWGVEIRKPGRIRIEHDLHDQKLDKDEVIRDYTGGESLMSMSERLDVSKDVLADRLEKWGVRIRNKHEDIHDDELYLENLKIRFWAKVDKRGPKECWEWQGHTKTRGYGQIAIRGKPEGAHRVSYELNIGPIGEGNLVAHLCDNPSCVNPNHLLAATPKFNVHDCITKGRWVKGVEPAWAQESE